MPRPAQGGGVLARRRRCVVAACNGRGVVSLARRTRPQAPGQLALPFLFGPDGEFIEEEVSGEPVRDSGPQPLEAAPADPIRPAERPGDVLQPARRPGGGADRSARGGPGRPGPGGGDLPAEGGPPDRGTGDGGEHRPAGDDPAGQRDRRLEPPAPPPVSLASAPPLAAAPPSVDATAVEAPAVAPTIEAAPVAQPFRPRSQADLAPSGDRKSTRLNSSHVAISYAVFCLKKKKKKEYTDKLRNKSNKSIQEK